MCSRSFETPSVPSSLAATHRGFAFYVADPISSIPVRSFALPSFQRSPITHHKRLTMRAKSNGNLKFVSPRCRNQVAGAATDAHERADDSRPDRSCNHQSHPKFVDDIFRGAGVASEGSKDALNKKIMTGVQDCRRPKTSRA